MNDVGKIHVLYLVSRLRRQGPIFQLYNMIKYLDRRRFHPHVVTLSAEAPESLLPAFEELGVECRCFGLSRIAGVVLGPERVRKLLQKDPACLIHACDYRAVLVCANRRLDIPRVVTCRQQLHHSFGSGYGPILGNLLVKTFSTACRKCERVVGVSDFVRRSAGNGLAERMTVIYNGVDQDIFRPIDKEGKAALRSRLNLPLDKHIFLSVGFLSRRKDPLTVLRAFSQVNAHRTAVLLLLGDGPLREQCLPLAGVDGNVRVLGFVQNVKDYLRAADTFISASLTEGCPNTVMEALACGLPVVLSDIPPHREILAFNEGAGHLFPIKDVAALSDILSVRAGMGCSEPSGAALSIIENHLNARSMSLKYQELYMELCR